MYETIGIFSDIKSIDSPIKRLASPEPVVFSGLETFSLEDSKPQDLSYFNHIVNSGLERSKTVNFMVACMVKHIMKEKGGTKDEEKELEKYLIAKKSEILYVEAEKDQHKNGIDETMQIIDYNDINSKLSLREKFVDKSIEIKDIVSIFKEHQQVPIINESLKIIPISKSIRLANYNELLTFSSLPKSEFERALLLLDFEKSLQNSQPERD